MRFAMPTTGLLRQQLIELTSIEQQCLKPFAYPIFCLTVCQLNKHGHKKPRGGLVHLPNIEVR